MSQGKKSPPKRRRSRRPVPVKRVERTNLMPGSIIAAKGASPTTLRVISYDSENMEEFEMTTSDSIKGLIKKGGVHWIDIVGKGDEAFFASLVKELNIHTLAMEDALTNYQRPKFEEYEELSHMVIRMPHPDKPLYLEQLSIFWGANFVITVQEREGDPFDPLRKRIRTSMGRIRSEGADYLVYAIVDTVMDAYIPIIGSIAEELEVLEEAVLSGDTSLTLTRPHQLRKELNVIRRVCVPIRDLLAPLHREELPYVKPRIRPYFRDCADHVVQLIEMIDVERDFCSSVIDLSVSNRMNEIMKVLTLISTIFIPLSFIAGLYGMNFQFDKSPWNMPELKWYFGYPLVLVLMISVAFTMVLFFKRRGWIFGGSKKE